MLYLLLKSLHIVAAILWVGSLLLVSFITSKNSLSQDQIRSALQVTEAAIGLTWIIGIILTIMGSWYTSPWWYLKITLVVLISAIHTFVHRRWKNDMNQGVVSTHKAMPFIILVSALLIVFLVVSKI